MKRTDLVKGLARKLEGKMKTAGVPPRFAQGSAAVPDKRDQRSAAAAKLVPVACRLPAELANRLRERAIGQDGGVNAVIAQALEQLLGATEVTPPPAPAPQP